MKKTQRCSSCHLSLEINNFSSDKSRPSGHCARCKECDAIWSSKRDYKTQPRKKYLREYSNKYRLKQKNQGKLQARRLFTKALRDGEIKKSLLCSVCDSDRNIEAHHEDYSKPLDVIWLCKKHHWRADKGLLAI